MGRSSELKSLKRLKILKTHKKRKKSKMGTNRRTDGQTKRVVESRSARQSKEKRIYSALQMGGSMLEVVDFKALRLIKDMKLPMKGF